MHEGIMPICQNEAGVAVVLSHEIAHALARHGGERMSQSYVVNGVGTAVGYMTRSQDAVLRQRINTVYGLSSKYGFILPYSRKHESEADHMGLLLMAQAGYDPSEAPRFWTRFGGQQSAKPPEFLSTHPADDRRAHELQELLPQAVSMYEQSPQKLGARRNPGPCTHCPTNSPRGPEWRHAGGRDHERESPHPPPPHR